MADENKKSLRMVSRAETDQISRKLLSWLNLYEDKPANIAFEFLPADQPGMTISTIQGAYKVKEYVRGAYQGQYQFKLVYRLQPSSNNARLKADEILDEIGDWAVSRRPFPDIGTGKQVMKITCNTRAAMFARYDDNTEDHQILMTLDYFSS